MRKTMWGLTLAAICAGTACGKEEQAVESPSSTSKYTLESFVCIKPWEVADVPKKGEYYASNPTQYQLFCSELIKSSDHVYSVPCDTEFTPCMSDASYIPGLKGKEWATHGMEYDDIGFENFGCGTSGADSVDSSWAHRQPDEIPYQVLSVGERLVPVWCPAMDVSLPYGGFFTDGLTVWTDNTRTTPEARLDLFVDCYVPEYLRSQNH